MKHLIKKTAKAILTTLVMAGIGTSTAVFMPMEPGMVFAAEVTSGDYTYNTNSNGTITITKYNGNAATLTIPSTIDGKSVTKIGTSAFEGNEKITSVMIPDGVKTIGKNAFSVCDNLTTVKIPNSVTSIGDCAFTYCDKISSITIPGSIITIGEGAFENCFSLKSVTISNGVKTIGESAFAACGLTSVKIPGSVTKIGKSSFDCSKLTDINVVSANKKYSSKDGVLFNKNKTTLVRYPQGKTVKSYSVPSGVKTIGESAFVDTKFKSVKLSKTVKTIKDRAFYGSDLTSVEVPDGVKTIGNYVFYHTENLKAVTLPNSVKNISENFADDFDEEGTGISIIYGGKNSAAQKYAKEEGIKFVSLTPARVSGLKVAKSTENSLKLNWKKNTKATGYVIEQKVNGKWKQIKKITRNKTTSYTVKKLKKSTKYNFRIRGYKTKSGAAFYSGYKTISGKTTAK